MIKNKQKLERWVNSFTNSIVGLIGVFALSILAFISNFIELVVFIIVTAYYRIKYGKNYHGSVNEFISTNLKDYSFFKNFNLSFDFSQHKIELLFFSALFYLFAVYVLLGSSSILFSNEGIWLVVLSVAVVFGNIYYQTHFSHQKSNFEAQIDSITKLLSQNAELVEEIGNLENLLISVQEYELTIIETFYDLIDSLEINPIEDFTMYYFMFEASLNAVFLDHFRYISSLTIFGENLLLSVELKDLNEEIVEEGFEN